jgi:hypothetical protein
MRSAAVLAFFVLGCTAQASKDPLHPGEVAGSDSGVVCHEVSDTGTMFTHTECTPLEEKEAQRDDARRFLKHRTSVQGPK